ncbi:MAG: SidA/IucD/PvdA family monooxygenase [Proteobacteria bacterium]|nr:SidA/IucD/PvdA family monooxygenase [Pseudomonadota bacterium]
MPLAALLTAWKNKAPPGDGGLLVFTLSGGAASILADECAAAGVPVPRLSEATLARLRALLPDYVKADNPLDVGGAVFSDPELPREAMAVALADPAVDAVLWVGVGAPRDERSRLWLDQAIEVIEASDKPGALIPVSGHPQEAGFGRARAVGIPVLRSLRAAATLIGHAREARRPGVAAARPSGPVPALPRADGLVELRLLHRGRAQQAFARRVVLATGRAGLGGPWVPDWVHALPPRRWAHSADAMDDAALKGLRVGVVGAGASAMDSAATALEAGAERVHLLVRRADIPRINKGKGAGSPGFVHGHARLADDWKWRIRHYINVQQVPPPRNSTLRVSRHANAFFHLGCAVQSAQEVGDALRVQTSAGPITLDFLIFATGFAVDWSQRPMLRHLAPHVRLWKHRYQPPPGDGDAELAESPDLGSAFEFQPRADHPLPGLERVHCFAYPAALSLGVITGDIPAISDGALLLATQIAGLLYAEDVALHYRRMQDFAEPEVFGDEWVASPLPKEESPR